MGRSASSKYRALESLNSSGKLVELKPKILLNHFDNGNLKVLSNLIQATLSLNP